MTDIYLDNSATTQVLPEVVEAMRQAMEMEYGNPSSLHGKGIAAERLIQRSREEIAASLRVSPREIFFTSGGTEANNWVIIGTARQKQGRGKHIISTQIEHASVLAPLRSLEREGFRVTYLPVDEAGLVSQTTLEAALTKDTILVSIMAVNNEVGTIQPIEALGFLIKDLAPQALFHVDGVQAFGKLPLDPHNAKADLLTLSAHKIHGPKGMGALYIRKGVTIIPLLMGGEQESRLRAGTENVPGIAGFASATLAAIKQLQGEDYVNKLAVLLRNGLLAISGCHFNGSLDKGLPYIMNVWFEGVDKGEVLVHMLEERGVYVSTGSACHSRRDDPSHVLKAMNKQDEALYGAIRISLSSFNTSTEIKEAVNIIKETVIEYREFRGKSNG